MIAMLGSRFPAIAALVSSHISSKSRHRITVTARCVLLVLLVCSWGKIAAAQTAHFVGVYSTLAGSSGAASDVAIDTNGNVYLAEWDGGTIDEIVAVNGSVSASSPIRTLAQCTIVPSCASVAVDSSGNVYFIDYETIKEILAVNGSIPASPVITTIKSTVAYPEGLAVDGNGDVYVADSYFGTVNEIVAINGTIPASPTTRILASGLSQPEHLALDNTGNLYVSAFSLVEILAVNGSIPASPTVVSLPGGAPEGNRGVAVDSSGNVYSGGYNQTNEIMAVNGIIPTSPTVRVLTGAPGYAYDGLAVDKDGNVFVSDMAYENVLEISTATPKFGSVNIGTTSSAIPLTFMFDTTGTLGSINVLTQGATGLDFTNAGTGTCTANRLYIASTSCTINVTFTPRLAGIRNGAIELNDTNGNVIATAYLQGTGVGPQINFLPGTQSTLGSNFDFAAGVAVDGNGNAYIIDLINNVGNVQEIMAVNGTIPANPSVKTLVGGLDCPGGPALDAAGDIYYVDICYHTVNEIRAVNGSIPTSPTVTTLTSQFAEPADIAVDGSGNVYVLDASNNTVNEIYAVNGSIPASPTITTLASGFKEVDDIAVDGSGNVYVSDDLSREVFEVQAVNGSIPASPSIMSLGSGFVLPRGITVDAAGNVYVAEYYYNTVYKLLAVNGSIPASPAIQTLGSGLLYANGVALDGNRNVFVADYGDARVVRLDFADPPSLTFASTAYGATSADSPQTVTIQNVGDAALTFPVPSSGNNPSMSTNFTLNSSGEADCTVLNSSSSGSATLAAGASCQLPISFMPTTEGALNGSLLLTDNNLNAASPNYAAQTIQLKGTAVAAAPTIAWTAPAAITYGAALSGAQLNATASVPGTFAYSPAAGAVLSGGTQILSVTFTPNDTTDYTTATSSVPLTVNPAAQTISFAPVSSSVTYGVAPIALSATSSSGLSISFSVSGSAALNGNVLKITGAGTIVVTANQAGNGNYAAATQISQSIAVAKAMLTMTATNVSVAYNQSIPALTGYSGTGFVNGDTQSILSGTPSEATTATTGSPAGTYPITILQGTLTAANYNFTFVNGTLTITASAPVLGFAQVSYSDPQVSTTTVTATYPSAQTAGDMNIVAVGWNDTTSTVRSVTDSAGNPYSLAVGPTTGKGLRQSIYYAPNIAGGTNKVTVTFNQAPAYPDVRILEYRGVSVLDVTATGTGTGTAAKTGSATTSNANELIFAADMVLTSTKAAGSGFKSRIVTSPDSDLVEDKIVTAAGSQSATATLSPSAAWVIQMATFAAATGP